MDSFQLFVSALPKREREALLAMHVAYMVETDLVPSQVELVMRRDHLGNLTSCHFRARVRKVAPVSLNGKD